jgi:hypothetical protein
MVRKSRSKMRVKEARHGQDLVHIGRMEDPMAYEIYRLICPSNRSYVGQAKVFVKRQWRKGAERRWQEHKWLADRQKEGPLYDAIREHGADSFKLEVLLRCHQREADMYETTMIKAYDSLVTGKEAALKATASDHRGSFFRLNPRVKRSMLPARKLLRAALHASMASSTACCRVFFGTSFR